MDACVVGGAGKMAEAAIRDLVESAEVESIVLADLNEAGLAARRDALASARFRLRSSMSPTSTLCSCA